MKVIKQKRPNISKEAENFVERFIASNKNLFSEMYYDGGYHDRVVGNMVMAYARKHNIDIESYVDDIEELVYNAYMLDEEKSY